LDWLGLAWLAGEQSTHTSRRRNRKTSAANLKESNKKGKDGTDITREEYWLDTPNGSRRCTSKE
jgi:hypothetical protein